MGAKFGLDAYPERPYMPVGFQGHESKKRQGDEGNPSRRSKSPALGLNSSLGKINVQGKQAEQSERVTSRSVTPSRTSL